MESCVYSYSKMIDLCPVCLFDANGINKLQSQPALQGFWILESKIKFAFVCCNTVKASCVTVHSNNALFELLNDQVNILRGRTGGGINEGD